MNKYKVNYKIKIHFENKSQPISLQNSSRPVSLLFLLTVTLYTRELYDSYTQTKRKMDTIIPTLNLPGGIFKDKLS